MNGKELKAQRVRLFRDAANFKKTERIPHFANVVTWKVFDAGHTLDEAMTNFDVMEKCVLHFLDKYPGIRSAERHPCRSRARHCGRQIAPASIPQIPYEPPQVISAA